LDIQGNGFSLGLMDYHARFFDDALGRFISPDIFTFGGSQGLNRYSYGLNNPVKYTDPSGHCVGPGGHDFPDGNPACNSGGDNGNDNGNNNGDNNGSSNEGNSGNNGGDSDGGNSSCSDPLSRQFNPNCKAVELPKSHSLPLEPASTLSPSQYIQRLVEIDGGLFLISDGLMIISYGTIVIQAALIELAGGEFTGPFSPLVFVDAGLGLAVGFLIVGSGIVVSVSGVYFVYEGITGKNPMGEINLRNKHR
jgi:RHS repeat-associated protein